MKKLMTAAILLALSVTGVARSDEGTKVAPAPVAGKAEVKKIKIEQVGQMLEAMGYEPKETKDKEGKLDGYVVKVTRGNTIFTICIGVAKSETVVWVDTRVLNFDDKEVATVEAILEILAQQHKLWPAYVVYYKNGKILELSMPVEVRDLTPQKLRGSMDEILNKYFVVIEAIKAAKPKAPNPPAEQRN